MKKGRYKRLSDILKKLDEENIDPDEVLVNEDEVIQEVSEDEEDQFPPASGLRLASSLFFGGK